MNRSKAVGLEKVFALDMVEMARALMARDRSWKTETFEVADGHAVLFGPGLYVNRVLAAGLETDVTDIELDLLEERCHAVGVPAALEINELTLRSVVRRLVTRGYRLRNEFASMVRVLDARLPIPDDAIEVERIGEGELAVWQDASAEGWGHSSSEAHRASDAFGVAATDALSPGLLLARSARDGRVVGCASLSIRDGVASLGGMSTLPGERRQGVQGALIAHRLRMATDAGCSTALAQCEPDRISERNLTKHGFVRIYKTAVWEAPPP